jgi:hypothetical protein
MTLFFVIIWVRFSDYFGKDDRRLAGSERPVFDLK